MKINVIDLESTCWNFQNNYISEIIQIGISQLDTNTRSITPAYSVFVRPKFTDELSDFCKSLTGLTDGQVFGQGVPFPEAMETLKPVFKIHRLAWGSWGDYDRRKIAEDAVYHGISNPVSSQHLNIKIMYSTLFNNAKGLGMDKAIAKLGMNLEGRHHDGGDDAYNIARILERITL